MQNNNLPIHWHFALVAALRHLDNLVWNFDELAATIKFVYTGFPNPIELIAIVNAFLAENDLLPEGDRGNLLKMRDYLQTQLVPIYERGQDNARRLWEEADHSNHTRMLNLKDSELLLEVDKIQTYQQMSSQCEKRWFLEGFAQKWGEETISHFKSATDRQ